jgi:hypothetical protein
MSFMLHPSRQNCFVSTAVAKGLGINNPAVNPMWEAISYSPDRAEFKRNTLCLRVIPLAPAIVPFGFSHPEHLGLRVGVFG